MHDLEGLREEAVTTTGPESHRRRAAPGSESQAESTGRPFGSARSFSFESVLRCLSGYQYCGTTIWDFNQVGKNALRSAKKTPMSATIFAVTELSYRGFVSTKFT